MKKHQNQILQNLQQQNNNQNQTSSETNILCLDYGTKFCGLAFSPDGICVFPLKVIPTETLYTEIQDTIQVKNIEKLVVGLPFEKDGTENDLCRVIQDQIQLFIPLLPVETVNERFSSQNVVISGSKKQRIDDLAAAQILEFYLRSL